MNLPIGSIILWDSETIPDGWVVCDGSNGSVNLVDKFPMGANTDGDLKASGGTTTHTHTNSNTGTVSAHGHGNPVNVAFADSDTKSVIQGADYSFAGGSHNHSANIGTSDDDSHSHTIGSTNAGSHLPPYKKLYYIERVA